MTVLRTVFFVVLATLGCLVAAVVGIAALIVSGSKATYDSAHPDYAAFAARFAEVRRAFEVGEDWAVIDLAPVNGGAWRTACLFGGYTWPIKRMEALGAVVGEADRRRLAKPTGLRVSPVEEFEVLIAYMDEEQRAHFVHFGRGVGPAGQHYEMCVTKPRTKVAVGSERPRTPYPLGD